MHVIAPVYSQVQRHRQCFHLFDVLEHVIRAERSVVELRTQFLEVWQLGRRRALRLGLRLFDGASIRELADLSKASKHCARALVEPASTLPALAHVWSGRGTV